MPEYLQQKMCRREGEWRKRKGTCAELQLLEVFLLMLFDDECLNQSLHSNRCVKPPTQSNSDFLCPSQTLSSCTVV